MSRHLSRRTFVFGAALASLVSACGQRQDSPQSALAFEAGLAGAEIEALLRSSFIPEVDAHARELIAGWEQDKDVTISVLLSDEWRQDGFEAAAERRGPDVAELFGNAPHELADHLVDVSELAETILGRNRTWSDVAKNNCMVNGAWRAVPWSIVNLTLVTRSDILDEVGLALPETYDDLLEVATVLRDNDAPQVGLTMGPDGPNDSAALAYSLLWSFGGQEVDENGRVALDSQHTIEVLDYFAELAAVTASSSLDYGEADNNSAFLNGEIAMTQNASSIYWRARQETPTLADATTHVPMPRGPAGQFQLPEVNSLAIFKHSGEVVAAEDFIRHVTAQSVVKERAEISLAFNLPATEPTSDDVSAPIADDPRLAGITDPRPQGRSAGWPLPANVESGLVYKNRSIVNMFSAVGRGQMTSREAAATATEELKRVYET